jgi:hypothetical protein
MKAKEYTAKYFSDVTANTTVGELSAKIADCYNEFSKEIIPLLKSVQATTSLAAKLDEVNKKWQAVFKPLQNSLMDQVSETAPMTPEGKLDPDAVISKIMLQGTGLVFERNLEDNHPELFALLKTRREVPLWRNAGQCM